MKFPKPTFIALVVFWFSLLAGGRDTDAQTATLLHVFLNDTNNGGLVPSTGALAQARDGNFYGTTIFGGAYRRGTVYRMTPEGVFTTIASFDGTNSGNSPNGVMQGSDGYLYGTTYGGAPNGDTNAMSAFGTVFRVATNGGLNNLATFDSTNYGSRPVGVPVQGADGILYGSTRGGQGTGTSPGYGTIFSCTTNGVLNAIYTFNSNNVANDSGGEIPNPVTLGPGGVLYGTTQYGGIPGPPFTQDISGPGTAFKVTTDGVFTILAYFNNPLNPTNGSLPMGPLLAANDGSLYGTTFNGGSVGTDGGNDGTVFRLTPGGILTDVARFDGTNNLMAEAGLAQAPDGSFYGTTYGADIDAGIGAVFRLSASGMLTNVLLFDGYSGMTNGTTGHVLDGGNPSTSLMIASDGNIYGTSTTGGVDNKGTIFRINLRELPVVTLQAVSLSNGVFNFQMDGETTGAPVVVFASTKLQDWVPILTNPPASGPMQFQDVGPANSPCRFYQAREEF